MSLRQDGLPDFQECKFRKDMMKAIFTTLHLDTSTKYWLQCGSWLISSLIANLHNISDKSLCRQSAIVLLEYLRAAYDNMVDTGYFWYSGMVWLWLRWEETKLVGKYVPNGIVTLRSALK